MISVLLLDTGNPREELNEPIGIENLAGSLKSALGELISVTVASLQIHRIETILPQLQTSDIVGISVQIDTLPILSELLNNLAYRMNYTDRPIVVLGGILPTFASEQLILEYPSVICVKGEGEDAITGIVECFLEQDQRATDQIKEDLLRKKIPNLALKLGDEIVVSEVRTVNLQTAARPSRDLLPHIIKQKGIARIEGSRGCPWNRCSFCSICTKYNQTKWRAFPISRVIDELETLSECGVDSPYFTDEDFIGDDLDRIVKLTKAIIEAKRRRRITENMGFFISTSVNTILRIGNETQIVDLFTQLRRAGLREVFLGIESGSAAQLIRYNKGVTSTQNAKVISILNKIDLDIDIGFIMFDPEMIIDDLINNLQFIRENNLDRTASRLTKPVRLLMQTQLLHKAESCGLVNGTFNLNSLSYDYNFRDPAIRVIFQAFSNWEIQTQKQLYEVQSWMRGQALTSIDRTRAKQVLEYLRCLDIDFLEKCVLAIRHGDYNSLFDNDSSYGWQHILRCKRNQLIETAFEVFRET